ncbi:class I SAM-dependent methyltransferase [Paucibacter sp. APW11]|uniref:Class I SAM-dependent methyltransferase n=1 Tax=Roseateles aquae TaxID=3077235 RepID=A0ABU3P588_9BURK|nr:class I SAM-dependent methyltransferase [Paucibacter sp. APW11]MDT8997729.1 class I SAM-dependent methyltransferase [Paucibacter sp. APW11]
MNLSTLRKLIFEKNILSFLRLSGQTQSLYRCAFATAAGSSGVLNLLSSGPRAAPEIAQGMKLGSDKLHALEAWLECGVKAGELALSDGRYRLKGKLSRLLAQPRNGISASLFEEVTRYHYDAILQAPRKLRDNDSYTLDDQDGELIARSSRILEPFVEEAVDWAFAGRRPRSVLEVGCGAGHYLRYMKQIAPQLEVSAIDYQASVVDAARRNLSGWGVNDVLVEHADVFSLDDSQRYELITLHNNIYYFAADRRDALLRKVRSLLAPSGRLLLTSSCQGGSPAVAALHLWWSLSDVPGGLPDKRQLQQQLLDSGFTDVQLKQLLPGESYYGFLAS